MKVIFVTDVANQGKAGEIKEVAEGFARNYLLPKRLAVIATPGKAKEAELYAKQVAARRARTESEFARLAAELEGREFKFTAKAGKSGRLYGAITNADIAQAIKKLTNVEVDKRKVDAGEALRQLGVHEVTLKFSKDIQARIKVIIEAEKEEKA